MKLSILTATYNRGNYLLNIYESIINNLKDTKIDTEWIIIDDGSTDATLKLIKNFKKHDCLEIKYIYQNNAGKMQALNNGMNEITGDIVLDCDSDDFFEENAFRIIKKYVDLLLTNEEIYALCFLKKNINGQISGKVFKENFQITTMFDLYFKDNMNGEKILIFDSKIRKKYKHNLEKNERFITEARMYHKMDDDYKILCINEPIEIGNYLEDGYTKNIVDTFNENPIGYYMYYKEILKKGFKGVGIRKRIYVIKNYFLFWWKSLKNRK